MDGDWSLVDLGDPIPKEATKVAHALGMNFEEFMYMVLEEKLQTLRNEKASSAIQILPMTGAQHVLARLADGRRNHHQLSRQACRCAR